jgi:hypothetical protein
MSGLQVGSYRDLRPGEIASLFEALKIDAVDDDSALVSTGGRKR